MLVVTLSLLIVALAIACISLFLRLKALEQRMAAMALEATGSQEPPAAEQSPVPLPHRRMVVVVYDNAEMRQRLSQQLSDDFEVLTAENGEQALALIRQSRPDVVVSEVRMPGMTGYELCHALRNDPDTARIPVILTSALSERENIIYGLEAGAADYIVKPFDTAVLRDRIRAILNRSQESTADTTDAAVLSKAEYKSRQDRELMDRVVAIIKERLVDSDFSINELCQVLGMSRTAVYGKIKVLTGHGPNDLIKTMRLSEARELLLSRELSVSEVAYRVGFSDPKYFSTCFKKQYGISPTKV